jgi:uncharacterized protein YggT (Ycf19 family)
MEDHTVAMDEARRDAQQASIKSQVAHDVNADIAQRAEHPTSSESQRMDKVAGNLRGKAIDQVVSRDRAVGRARGLARFSQVVDYVFYVLYTLLLVRLVLALIGANSSTGFVQLIRTITNPFYAMFRGIVESPTAEGGGTLALPIIIAIVAYIVLHGIIRGLLHLMANRRTQI